MRLTGPTSAMRRSGATTSAAPPGSHLSKQMSASFRSGPRIGARSRRCASACRSSCSSSIVRVVTHCCEGGRPRADGQPPGRVLGQSIFAIYARCRRWLAQRCAWRWTAWRPVFDRGAWPPARGHVSAETACSGAIDGLIGISYDVSELHGASRELETRANSNCASAKAASAR